MTDFDEIIQRTHAGTVEALCQAVKYGQNEGIKPVEVRKMSILNTPTLETQEALETELRQAGVQLAGYGPDIPSPGDLCMILAREDQTWLDRLPVEYRGHRVTAGVFEKRVPANAARDEIERAPILLRVLNRATELA